MNKQSQIKQQIVLANNDNLSDCEVKSNSEKVAVGYIDFYQCIDSDGATPYYVLGYN